IAYRTKMKGKTNIHYAKEVIDFIASHEKCFVFVTDFKDFFDRLNHKYLKEKICDVLNVDRLSTDFYKVFRNITKYSYIEKHDIERYYMNQGIKRKDVSNLSRFFTPYTFRKFKKGKVYKHQGNSGIPQGASISAVCSNVYMIDFDYWIAKHINVFNGLYRRYSDDLIIAIPVENHKYAKKQYKKLNIRLKELLEEVPDICLHPEKTECFYYTGNQLIELESEKPAFLDYLGFTFDGHKVSLREKSLFKYYSKAY